MNKNKSTEEKIARFFQAKVRFRPYSTNVMVPLKVVNLQL